MHLLLGLRFIVSASFDFHENQRLSITGDDVDLSQFAAEISHDDLVTLIPQELRRDVLPALAQGVALLALLSKRFLNQSNMRASVPLDGEKR